MQRKMRRKWQREMKKAVAHYILPTAVAAGIALSSYGLVLAAPNGGEVTSGSGSISSAGTTTMITQNSDKLIIDWQSFSIGEGERVFFIQPGVDSIALNRVIGNDVSILSGMLSANGRVFLINPNGILFSSTARVNVGSLLASTLNITNDDFLSGNYQFNGQGNAAVINQGQLVAGDDGYIVLLGSQTSNEGLIVAREGTVAMAAGDQVTLDFYGDGLLNLAVDQGALNALADNRGLIQTDGGQVIMTARTANALAGTVINNSGIIQARSIRNDNGVITLDGGTSGTVNVSGTLDASGKETGQSGGSISVLGHEIQVDQVTLDASGDRGGGVILIGGNFHGAGPQPNAEAVTIGQNVKINADALTNGNGGQVVIWADTTTNFAGTITARGGKFSGNGGNVETSGKKQLKVGDTARVDTLAANGATGNWLLDPADFTIAASGGDMTGAALANALESNNVTILSSDGNVNLNGDGSIYLNDAVGWTADNNKLTLSAGKNIYINADISASGSGAGLVLTPGASGSYILGSGAKITLSGENATFQLGGTNYIVINNHSTGGVLQALQNIGVDNTTLSGKYVLGVDIDAGNTINWNSDMGFSPIGSDSARFTGVFDGLGHDIDKLHINRADADYVGLFGYSTGTVRNVTLLSDSTHSITGKNYVGALVGYNKSGVITNCSVGDVIVTGIGDNVGGLIGASENANITYCSSGATVTGASNVGGLVGYFYSHSDCYATSSEQKSSNVSFIINESYSTGAVTGSGNNVGGLVGYVYSYGSSTADVVGRANSNVQTSISNAYSTGAVNGGGDNVGGLVGYNYNYSYSHATDIGEAYSNVSSSINNSYSTGAVTGGDYVGGLIGHNYSKRESIKEMIGDAGSNTSSSISDSSSRGTVNGTSDSNYVGGLVGANWGNITTCSVEDVTITGYDNLGGLAGYNSGNISDCTVDTVTITGHDNLGGLVGAISGNIINSYISNSVTVNGNSNIGGLVGLSNSGAISGCHTSNGNVTGAGDNIGGLAGKSTSVISNSYSTGVVTSTNTSNYVGGLVGYNAGNITTCSVEDVMITGYDNIGGLVGYQSGNISDCFANNISITGHDNIGGLVGRHESGTISNCSSSGEVNGFANVGGLVGYNYSSDSCYAGIVENRSSSASYSIIGSHSSANVSGAGDNVGGLVGYNYNHSFSQAGQAGRASSTLNSSITNSYSTGIVTGSGNNVGGLVGNNYNYSDSNADFTSDTSSSVNFSMSNCYSTGAVNGTGNNIGGLVGNNSRSTSSYSNYANSISLNTSSSISDSYSTGTVTSTNTSNYVGGLIGYNVGNITNCSVDSVTITGYDYLGGLTGYSSGNISDCTVGSVTITGYDNLGGLVGSTSGNITNSSISNSVTVNGNANIGGLVGLSNSGAISGCHISNGNVTGAGDNIGGLVGWHESGAISNCSSTGQVNGASNVGGLVGYNSSSSTRSATGIDSNASFTVNSSISNCYSIGTVTGVGDNIGGLVGYNTSSSSSSAEGIRNNVSSTANSSISNCFSMGIVTGGGDNIGGLVGYNSSSSSSSAYGIENNASSTANSSISTCFSMSAVIGSGNNIGGLVGNIFRSNSSTGGPSNTFSSNANSNISNSYSTGAVRGSSLTGGFVGNNNGNGTIVNCFWDIENSGQDTGVGAGVSSGLTGKTTREMMTQSIYPQGAEEWDFDSVWGIVEGVSYPYFRSYYPDTPQVVSGVLSSGGGQMIQAAVNGTVFGSGATGVNGFYTILLTQGTFGDEDAVLVYVDNSNVKGSAVCRANDDANIDGLDIQSGGVSVYYDPTVPGLNNLLTAAKGSLNDPDILYSSTNTEVQIAGDWHVKNAVEIGGNITATGTQTYNSAVTLESDSVLTGSEITFVGGVTGDYDLTVNGTTHMNGDMITNGSQTYNGAVMINYSGTTTIMGEAVTFAGPLTGDGNLSVTGSDGIVLKDNVITEGDQTYNGALTIDVGDHTLTLSGTRLNANGTLTTNGSGRWLACAPDAEAITGGFLSAYDFVQYGFTDTSEILGNGNGLIYAESLIFSQSLTGTVTKIYDGTTDVGNLTAANYQIGNTTGYTVDIVSAPATGTYEDKNVNSSGSTLLVTADSAPVLAVLDGNHKPVYGYEFSTPSSSGYIGTITVRPLTATQTGTVTKTYDRSTAASFDNSHINLVGIVDGEIVHVNGTGTYDSPNVGLRSVTVDSVTIDNSNYSLATTDIVGGTLTGQIDRKALTATQTGMVTKTYDGNSVARFDGDNISLSGILDGDSVSVIEGSGTYDSRNAGSRWLTVDNVTLDNDNYCLAATDVAGGTLTGRIDQRALTVSASVQNKIYDGTIAAAVDFSSDQVNGDTLIITGTATFLDKNVGTNKAVRVNVMNISSDDAGNYYLANTDVIGVTADIEKATLTIRANDAIKLMGMPNPSFSVTYDGFVPGESPALLEGVLALTTPATINSMVGRYDITPSGVSSANYDIRFVDGILTVIRLSQEQKDAITAAYLSMDGGWLHNNSYDQTTSVSDLFINIVGNGVNTEGLLLPSANNE